MLLRESLNPLNVDLPGERTFLISRDRLLLVKNIEVFLFYITCFISAFELLVFVFDPWSYPFLPSSFSLLSSALLFLLLNLFMHIFNLCYLSFASVRSGAIDVDRSMFLYSAIICHCFLSCLFICLRLILGSLLAILLHVS